MILFGASGHAKVIIDILKCQNKNVDFIFDDHPLYDEIYEIPIKSADQCAENVEAIISIGNNKFRKEVAERFSLIYQVAIHPSAVISSFSEILEGTVVMANAVVNPDAKIGKHCIINTSAIIEHDCVLEDFVHISPNASLAGNVFVGEGSQVGIGACVKQGVKIGKWCTVGAGAAIINDVPDYSVVVGVPGRIIKSVNK